MPKRKIRHALVSYSVEEDGVTRFETAFRNQVVDIPRDQVERLDALGATVAPDDELERPGRMSVLPVTATDAEILSWVMGASNAEIETLVNERPAMAARILAAHEAVQERFQEQNLHLGGLREIAEAQAEEALEEDTPPPPPTGEGDNAPAPEEGEEGGDDDLIGELTPERADEIVAGKAPEVAEFIANNPQFAGAILEAEGRRSETTKEPVRVTITRAAEAAAGFTAQ